MKSNTLTLLWSSCWLLRRYYLCKGERNKQNIIDSHNGTYKILDIDTIHRESLPRIVKLLK